MLESRNPRYDLFAVILLIAIVFLTASLLSYDVADPIGSLFPPLDQFYQSDILAWPQNEEPQNAFGHWGAVTADILYTTLGIGAFFLVIGLGAVAVALLQRQTIQSLWTKTVGWLLSLIGLTTIANMLFPNFTIGPIIGPGGYLGALGCGLLEMHFARTGGLILASSVLAIGLFLWTEYVIVRIVGFVLASALSVLSVFIPSESLQQLRQKLAKRPSSNEHPERNKIARHDLAHSEEDDEEETDDEEIEDEEQEFEEDDEEDELDGWDDDSEEERPTVPFILKTAAKTFTANRNKKKPDDTIGDVDEEDPAGSRIHKRPHFGFGRRKKRAEDNSPTEKSPPAKPTSERDQVITALNKAIRVEDSGEYDLPDKKLLTKSRQVPRSQIKSQTMRQGRRLEKKFLEFGHKIRVVDVETGPVITQYEIELEAGLRLSKITSLADDIAIGLRVPSVRIVAPIPGKNTVGIEVPNETRLTVHLRDVMEESSPQTRKMKIPLFLGKDVAGNTLVTDLAKLPHLLIAGRTGTGKSVCLNAIISSILMTRRPDEVRMLMIDPKMVELSGYGRLPHLMHPVVTDMRKAEAILAWAVDKMEERYKLLARAGVRHINSYNQLGEEELIDRLRPANDEERKEIPTTLPFIVFVADEMADLMMTAGKEVEQHIIRLAQKSRAVGIHLILATQKPTVDVITGLIKSNLPARISFQVASQIDSRVVLDSNGAEKLLGNGDMLFLWPGTSMLLRGQGTFLSDDEIDAITDSVSTGEQNFVNELVNMKVDETDDDLAGKLKNRDELYNKAVETVIRENRGSVSLLQRALGIGYGRAARLIDFMEEDGIVGPYAGSKSREIIMTLDAWHSLQAGESDAGSADDSGTAANPPGSDRLRDDERNPSPKERKRTKPRAATIAIRPDLIHRRDKQATDEEVEDEQRVDEEDQVDHYEYDERESLSSSVDADAEWTEEDENRWDEPYENSDEDDSDYEDEYEDEYEYEDYEEEDENGEEYFEDEATDESEYDVANDDEEYEYEEVEDDEQADDEEWEYEYIDDEEETE